MEDKLYVTILYYSIVIVMHCCTILNYIIFSKSMTPQTDDYKAEFDPQIK